MHIKHASAWAILGLLLLTGLASSSSAIADEKGQAENRRTVVTLLQNNGIGDHR